MQSAVEAYEYLTLGAAGTLPALRSADGHSDNCAVSDSCGALHWREAHAQQRCALPYGATYELSAESCIPGIETTDFVNIFEEQAVHRSMVLADAGLPANVFAEDERLFCFGSPSSGASSSSSNSFCSFFL